jgi:hypothetical protein
MRVTLVLAAALLAVALAGCTGNSVTVSGQGTQAGTQTKSLQCGSGDGQAEGRIAYGSQGAGTLNVRVTDGGGVTVYEAGSGMSAGQGGDAGRIVGRAGTWTLRVEAGLGYAGQWAVTLSC